MRKLLKIVIAIVFILVIMIVLAVSLIMYSVWPPNEMTVKRRFEAKGLLPLMIAGAQRDANGVTPVFSNDDEKRLNGAGVRSIDSLYSLYHIDRKALQFDLGGPEEDYGILVVTDGQAPPDTAVQYDLWGNGIYFYASWPLHKR